MSASPIARQATQTESIPSTSLGTHNPNQLPAGISSTPGGTLYSTTPGGTRIVYERDFLMNLRNSPISRTPPRNCNIPAELLKSTPTVADPDSPSSSSSSDDVEMIEETAEQFELEM